MRKKPGDHTIIKCSNCDKELLDILHTVIADIDCKVEVMCPCGDYSYPQTIHGLFSYSPAMEIINNTEKVELFVDDIIQNEEITTFIMKKQNA